MNLTQPGFISDEIAVRLGDSLDFMVENDLNQVELRTIEGANIVYLSDGQVADLYHEIVRRQLSVSCIASPVFKCPVDANRPVASGDQFGVTSDDVEHHLHLLERACAVAKQLGCDHIRIFSFWRDADVEGVSGSVLARLQEAVAIARGAGIQLLLENEPACNGGFSDEVAAMVGEVGSPHLRMLWDPGNDVFGGQSDVLRGYQRARPFVDTIHVKDVKFASDAPVFVPSGEGDVGYERLVQRWLDDGLTVRGLTLEPHLSHGGTPTVEQADRALSAWRRMVHRAQQGRC